eukprot:6578511-Prymnesium_polylepis.1
MSTVGKPRLQERQLIGEWQAKLSRREQLGSGALEKASGCGAIRSRRNELVTTGGEPARGKGELGSTQGELGSTRWIQRAWLN